MKTIRFILLFSLLQSCTKAQSFFMLSTGTSSAYDQTLYTLANDGRYNAFGASFANGSNIWITYRSGTSHTLDGILKYIPYDYTNNTYGTPVTIADYNAAGYGLGDFRGGILGGEKIIGFSRRIVNSTLAHESVGFIMSTDLTGSSWSTWTSLQWLVPTGITTALSFGNLIPSDVAGTYYQPCYGYNSGVTASAVWLWRIVYSGGSVTIDRIDVYNGTYSAGIISETDIVGIGGSKYIMIGRINERSEMVQFTSSDGGLTWSAPQDTNLGTNAGTNSMCDLKYVNGTLYCFYQDRYDGYIKISKTASPLTVFSNPTAWVSQNYYLNTMIAGGFFLGYPRLTLVPGTTNRFLLNWATETGSTPLTTAVMKARLEDFNTY